MKFFKGCLPQISLGSFLNTLFHMLIFYSMNLKLIRTEKSEKRLKNRVSAHSTNWVFYRTTTTIVETFFITCQFTDMSYAAPHIYLLNVNNRNTRTRCEICSKLAIKIPERHHWPRSGIFIVNFEHISYLVLVFLLLTLNI